MGLDTTHDCWHGGYGGFHVWRQKVAHAAGIPLNLMDGFYKLPYEASMEWAAPREGGPLCDDPRGTLLHSWISNAIEWLPLSWDGLKPDIIHALLNHPDCEGEIAATDCAPLADRLEALLPDIGDGEGNWPVDHWRDKTRQFIKGLRLAASRNEAVEFH